jgi:O-acetylhomoserine/O-acetylserine sulfhydrylase-like pyridoxal-dependent enzyme
MDALTLFCRVVNIGDARGLAIHLANTSHSRVTLQAQNATGVSDV